MTARARAALVAAGLTVGGPLAAQAPAACDSAAAFRPVAEGTDTLFVTAGPVPGAPAPTPDYLQSVVDAVGDEVRLPPALRGPVFGDYGTSPLGGRSLVRPGLGVTLVVDLGRDGRLARLAASQRSLADGVDAALAAAVRAADASRAFFARGDGPRTLSVAVRLTLRPDSAEARRPAALLRQPRYGPAEPARLLSPVPMPATEEARVGWTEGQGVRVEFEAVVDRDGRVVPGTERLVAAGNPAYAVQVFDWLRHEARFAPGRVAGCPVRQLARVGVGATARMVGGERP